MDPIRNKLSIDEADPHSPPTISSFCNHPTNINKICETKVIDSSEVKHNPGKQAEVIDSLGTAAVQSTRYEIRTPSFSSSQYSQMSCLGDDEISIGTSSESDYSFYEDEYSLEENISQDGSIAATMGLSPNSGASSVLVREKRTIATNDQVVAKSASSTNNRSSPIATFPHHSNSNSSPTLMSSSSTSPSYNTHGEFSATRFNPSRSKLRHAQYGIAPLDLLPLVSSKPAVYISSVSESTNSGYLSTTFTSDSDTTNPTFNMKKSATSVCISKPTTNILPSSASSIDLRSASHPFAESASRLGRRLQSRPAVDVLIDHNILTDPDISPGLSAAAKALVWRRNSDELNHRLSKRAPREALVSNNIMILEERGPKVDAAQKALRFKQKQQSLAHTLDHRSSIEKLVERHILPASSLDLTASPSPPASPALSESQMEISSSLERDSIPACPSPNNQQSNQAF